MIRGFCHGIDQGTYAPNVIRSAVAQAGSRLWTQSFNNDPLDIPSWKKNFFTSSVDH